MRSRSGVGLGVDVGLPEAVAVGVGVIAGMGVGVGPGVYSSGARRISACFLTMSACDLTFDMRGGRKWAKPTCGRPLDGRVRPRVYGKPLRRCARPDQ